MTLKETAQCMAILRQFYPQYYKNTGEKDVETAVHMWKSMFPDDDGNVVLSAIRMFIASDSKGFPPSVGQIREKIVKLKNRDTLGETEAWVLVSRAIKNSGYHAKEEFDKLPPDIQRVVSNPQILHDWAMASADDVQTVIASNFMRSYRERMKSEKEYAVLPQNIKAMLYEKTNSELPEPEDPEKQKREAILSLMESREREQRKILGAQYDSPEVQR